MPLDTQSMNNLVDLLSPLMRNEQQRRALLTLALTGASILESIDYTGETQTFLPNAIDRLYDYGEIESGKPALRVLLEHVCEHDLVGKDKKKQINELIEKLWPSQTKPNIEESQPRPQPPNKTGSPIHKKRRLDAAMPKQVPLGQSTEVRAKICLSGSKGLRAELPDNTETGQLIDKGDVGKSSMTLAFPVGEDGNLKPTNVRIKVEGENFNISKSSIDFELSPNHDSGTFTFILTPKKVCEYSLVIVEVLQTNQQNKEVVCGSVTLRTQIFQDTGTYGLTYMQWSLASCYSEVVPAIGGSQSISPFYVPMRNIRARSWKYLTTSAVAVVVAFVIGLLSTIPINLGTATLPTETPTPDPSCFFTDFDDIGCWRVRLDENNMPMGTRLSIADLSAELDGESWQSALRFDVNLSANSNAQIDTESGASGCDNSWRTQIKQSGQINVQLYLPKSAPQGLVLTAEFFAQFINPSDWLYNQEVSLEPGQVVTLSWDANDTLWPDWEEGRLTGSRCQAFGIDFQIASSSQVQSYDGPIYIDQFQVICE